MKSPAIIGCILLAFLTACAAPARPAAVSRPFPEPFVDATLKTMIEDRGGALATKGGLSSHDAAAQLERTTCKVALAPVSNATHDLAALYTQSVPATLVIARIYHCDKCQRWHTDSAATAFALSADGVCVTNYHVFDHAEGETTLVVSDAWGTTHLVLEILAANKRDDVAIFRVSVDEGPLMPLPLRPGADVGTQVAVISHPANHFYSLAQGIVSRRVWRYHGMNGDIKDRDDASHADAAEPHSADNLTRTLEITADYGVGSSGGPVLDLCGNVVGMVSNTSPVYADPKDRRSLQMNFHHCVPAESILALINAK